jgi:hypothetical protein
MNIIPLRADLAPSMNPVEHSLNRGRCIWVGVDEGLLEEGFDCQFFHRHRGGLGSTSSKATTVARGEREKRGQGG